MPSHKLGDAMFDENDMFENLFAPINVCPKLEDDMLNEYDLFSLPTLNDQISYDDCMPPIYDENKVATYDNYCDDAYVIKLVIIIVIIFNIPLLNITLLIWKQFLVFEFHMILPLL